MLLLNRYEGESIILNGNIEVKILKPVKFENDANYPVRKVRLGITAPKSVSVHRKEIQDAINREKSTASLLV